jgi:hypothetical protein
MTANSFSGWWTDKGTMELIDLCITWKEWCALMSLFSSSSFGRHFVKCKIMCGRRQITSSFSVLTSVLTMCLHATLEIWSLDR